MSGKVAKGLGLYFGANIVVTLIMLRRAVRNHWIEPNEAARTVTGLSLAYVGAPALIGIHLFVKDDDGFPDEQPFEFDLHGEDVGE